MATPATIANVGEPTVDASGLTKFVTPNLPEIPVASPGVSQTTQPPATPQVVRIGDQDLTPAQITEALKAQQYLVENKAKLDIGEAFALMDPGQQRIILDVSEALSKGIDPFAKTSKAPIPGTVTVPANADIPLVKWDDLGDGEQYAIARIETVRDELVDKLAELGGIITQMRGFLGTLNTKLQDEATAKALTLKGYKGVTADTVAEMRAAGFSDPIKAFDFLKSQQGAAAPAAPAAPGATGEGIVPAPEAPVGGSEKVFDADDPSLSLGEMLQLLNNGYLPKNPADLERLNALKNRMG